MLFSWERRKQPAPESNGSDPLEGRTVVELDLRGTPFAQQASPVLQHAQRLSDQEYLRITTRSVSWPVLASLQATGSGYRIGAAEDGFEIQVWRRLSDEQQEHYLSERLRSQPTIPEHLQRPRNAGGPASTAQRFGWNGRG